MSDDPERSFSAAGNMVTKKRNRLRGDVIEASQCLRNWFGQEQGLFDNEDEIEKHMDVVDSEIIDK